MLTRIGRLAVRRNGAVLIGALLVLLGLGAYGAGAQEDLALERARHGVGACRGPAAGRLPHRQPQSRPARHGTRRRCGQSAHRTGRP